MMENNYYYSLRDFIKLDGYEDKFADDITSTRQFYELYDLFIGRLGWGLDDEQIENMLLDPITKKLWFLIQSKNLSEDIVRTSKDYKIEDFSSTFDFYNAVFGEWSRKFLSVLIETYPRYKTIISLYEAQEQNLLKGIKNTSINLFNDTPQTIADFEGQGYVSNINKYEGETEGDTLINRLDDIRRKWQNIYREWASEFDSLFMEVM